LVLDFGWAALRLGCSSAGLLFGWAAANLLLDCCKETAWFALIFFEVSLGSGFERRINYGFS